MTTMPCYQLISLAALLLLAKNGVQAQETACYDNLDTVFQELGAEDVDLEADKLFVLCPNTVFDIGVLEIGVGIVDGQAFIAPRSNTTFSCGEDGSSTNSCILRGGDYGVVAFGGLFFDDEEATNVVIRGLTFEGQAQSMAAIQQAGDFHFEDCIFQNSNSFAPVIVNYDPVADDANASSTYFSECVFQNNTQRARELGVEFGVMTIVGAGNEVELDDCIFRDNKYADFTIAPVGYAVSVGANNAFVMKNSCILGNDFLGAGPVVLNPDTSFVMIGNNIMAEASLLLCEFAARFPTEEDVANLAPQCVDSQVDVCRASIYEG